MNSTNNVYRATVGLLWALALWHSWCCRGLFVDGTNFLLEVARRQWFFDFYSPRLYAMYLGQIPAVIGVKLGVTDLHWLAILLSLGLFGLPTLMYQFALRRARQDPVLLAVVLAAIGIVFMTTSFFIVGEYNSVYAIAILTAVHLATVRGLRILDALAMLAVGVLAIRTYEAMLYLGPLLAAMVLWMLGRQTTRRIVPTVIYVAVLVCFLLGTAVAIDSIVHPHSAAHLEETYVQALSFWQNMQFDLALVGALIVFFWGLWKPDDLGRAKPYLWALVPICLLILSPLLALTDTLARPLARSQYVARSAGGLVIVAMIAFIWLYKSETMTKVRGLAVLATPAAARWFLAFGCLIPLAVLPSDLFLTQTWVSYLGVLRVTVTNQSGVVAFEDTPLAGWPYRLLVDDWILSSQSLAVRSKPGDAIIAPPRGFKDWEPFPANKPPNMSDYFWRD